MQKLNMVVVVGAYKIKIIPHICRTFPLYVMRAKGESVV